MSLPRERIPDPVWRARDAEDRERTQAELDYDAHLAAVVPLRTPSQWEQVEQHKVTLDALVTTGLIDVCPRCGVRVCRQDGVFACAACEIGWES